MRRVGIELPEAPWVAVPQDGDAAAWAERTAAELADGGAPGSLAAELAAVAGQALAHEALACAVLVPDLTPPVVAAVLMVQQVQCGPDADAVLRELAGLDAGALSPPELSCVDLPLGRAARRHVVSGPVGGAVVERVEHIVPLGDGTGLRADLSWTALALGGALVDLADSAAAGLQLVDD